MLWNARTDRLNEGGGDSATKLPKHDYKIEVIEDKMMVLRSIMKKCL